MSNDTVKDVYDLTPLQQGMLFHALFEPEEQLYFEQITVPFDGRMNWPAFQRAWQDVADHHDALRTSFHWQGIATPVQVVHAEAKISVAAIDLLVHASDDRYDTLADFQLADRKQGFDLERPPLLRVTVVRTAPQQVFLVLSFHHIILDGWSLQLLLRDFSTAYRQRADGAALHLPEAGRYRDYLLWLQAQDLGAAETFWRTTLHGVERPDPLWSSGSPSAGFAEHETVFSAETTAGAERAAANCRVTLNTVAQATWALVMAMSTGRDSQTFGITVSGRPAELDGVENMVGLFINTIPLRLDIEWEAKVDDWLRQVQRSILEARQFEFTPLVDVQRWSGLPHGTGLFDNIVAFENYPIAASSDDSKVAATFTERTNYPLNAMIVPGERLSLRLLFDQRSIDEQEVRRIAERYEMVLLALGRDRLGLVRDLPTLTSSDHAIVASLNEPPRPLESQTAHGNFEHRVSECPDAVAMEFGGKSWTYRQLDGAANVLADRLARDGVGPGNRVVVFLGRSAEFVVALLAVLKTGAAYVPLDPDNSLERLRSVVVDTRPCIVLTSHDLTSRAAELGAATVVIAADPPSTTRQRVGEPGHPGDAAYVMYTSGSTGEPKGIVVPHRAINRLVVNTDYLQLGPGDRVAHLSNCSFDASTFEILGPLLNGATIIGVDTETALQPQRLATFLDVHSINVLFLTTALFNRIAAEHPTAFSRLDALLFGGEAVDPKWVRRVLEEGRPGRLLHVYGPTECTTFATWDEVKSIRTDATTVPIGRAVANTSVRVVDRFMRPVVVGSVGELYLGGVGVADGYLGRPAATAERFVPDESGGRMYRTGDRVRVTPAGLEFVGRVDEQIKLRGFRIEPGEIERVIMANPSVTACVVVTRLAHDGDRELVAYIASADGPELAPSVMRDLRTRVPRYMLPASIVVLPTLPLNGNGKIDRQALPEPQSAVGAGERKRVPPSTATEQRLAAIWSDVLGIEAVSVDDDFFELGGHSLRATQLLSRINRDLSIDLELRQVFDNPTIAGLARLLEPGTQPAAGGTRIVALRRDARLQTSVDQETDVERTDR